MDYYTQMLTMDWEEFEEEQNNYIEKQYQALVSKFIAVYYLLSVFVFVFVFVFLNNIEFKWQLGGIS